MPQIKVAIPLQNRKHFDTHSVFELQGVQEPFSVIYVHHDKTKGKRTFSPLARGRMLTVTMNTADYYDLWTGIWNASNPGLLVEVEQDKVVDLKAADLAK